MDDQLLRRRMREAVGPSKKLAEMVLKKRIVGNMPFSEFSDTYIIRHISLIKSVKTERNRVLFLKREFGSRPIGRSPRPSSKTSRRTSARSTSPPRLNG